MWVSRKLSNTRFPYSLFPWKQCCAFSKKVTKGSIQLSRTRTFQRSHNEVQYTDDERCWWEDSAAGKPKIVNCNQYAISPSALNKHRRKSFTSELNEKLRLRRKRMENKKTLQMQLNMSSKSPSHYLVKPVFISLESWTTLRPKYLRFFFYISTTSIVWKNIQSKKTRYICFANCSKESSHTSRRERGKSL